MPKRSHTGAGNRWMVGVMISGIAVLVGAAGAFAHDFWLVPDAFDVTPGGWIEVRGQTSSKFPMSEAAVALDRIAEAKVVTAQAEERVSALSHSGSSLLLRHRPGSAGQRIVAVRLHPRTARESPESFRRYLTLEGAPEALERYERQGLLPTDSITRRYAKYAKTVVEVGRGGPRAFARVIGHPLELVPLADPARARAGDSLSFRLLLGGAPLPNARLHAGVATATGTSASATADASSSSGSVTASGVADLSLTTDQRGVVAVPLLHAGLWNVRGIHILPARLGSGADWDVHWVTFVFRVQAGAAGATGGSDSAAVVAAIDAYHRALSSGDSTAALALLAADAVILESGGVETRAEYRGHHLPADIEFARAVPSVRAPTRVVVQGDAAWAWSTSTTQGEFRSRAINSQGAELMVLSRDASGWKIRAIHWSSRNRRQP